MKIISSGLLMISAAGITLGLVHLRFWFSQRERKDQLAFSVAALSLAVFAWFELFLMHAETPEGYGVILKWAQPVAGVCIVSSAWFVKENLGGRASLFWIILILRLAAILINFFAQPNITFSEIKTLGHATLLGESLSYPIGTPSLLALVPQAGLIVLVIYAIDSCIKVWIRGDRQKAFTFGAATLIFAFWVAIGGIGFQWGFLAIPLIVTPSLMVLAAPMLYELNYDMQRSARLSSRLLERERELKEALDSTNLSAAAAHLGLWSRKAGEDEIFLSPKGREIFEFPATGILSFSDFKSRVHPDDLERLTNTIRAIETDGGEYHVEYRLLLKGGRVKWIDSRGMIVTENGRPKALHGASLDITDRKDAEASVHALSGKLMDAQEKERARLARELHDDLSQRLALLSIKLEGLKSKPQDSVDRSIEIDHLISDVQNLSADVHRISHELHPAKLRQLGLEAALRGFCREVADAHPVKITFSAENIPRELPNHIALAIYRVAQESLQNVVKHSQARNARVELSRKGDELVLSVSDDGTGFDPNGPEATRSLGLISMHERIMIIKGTLDVKSRAGDGTCIVARIPLLTAGNTTDLAEHGQ